MPPKKRNRKGGKYAPLVWILTGALIAFFIAYSGSVKNFKFWQSSKSSSSASSTSQGFILPDFRHPSSSAGSSAGSALPTPTPVSSLSNQVMVKIYLASQGKNDIRLTEKQVSIPRSPSMLRATLEVLVHYREGSLLNLVPLNTKVRKVWIKDNIAYIDFSEDFSYNSYGITGYKVQLYQVVYTATQFAQVRAVYFYLEGKPMQYLGGDGYLIHNPVYPFSSLPSFAL